MFYCTFNVFDKSYQSKRFSDGDGCLFTPDLMRFNASTTRQNRLKMTGACNNLFVRVNEDNISEPKGRGVNAENANRKLEYAFCYIYSKIMF